MAVIFSPRANVWLPALLLAGPPAGLLAAVLSAWYWFSPWFTDVGYTPDQPVAYSHKLHAGDLGIDCRYCHDTVERGAFAAIPAVSNCMDCHKVVLPDSPLLPEVRAAADDRLAALQWARVHLLPDYAFFDHGVHVAAGVGCVTCHGRIDQMETTSQVQPLSMSWCWDCHLDPAPQMRPPREVTNMAWQGDPAFDPHDRDRFPTPPTHCSGCHQ